MKKHRAALGDVDALLGRIAELESLLESERVAGKAAPAPAIRYDHAFMRLTEPVIVYRDGIILFANHAAAKLHGAETTDQLVGEDILRFVHPDARERMLSRRAEVMAGKQIEPTARKGLRLDGSEITLESRGSPIHWDGGPAVFLVLRDVTERTKVEAALQTSERLYRELIEESSFGIQISRPGGKRLFVNRKMVEMFGFESAEELLALDEPGVLVAPHDRDWMVAHREARAKGDAAPESYEFDALREDGSIMPVQAFIRYVTWQGEVAVQRTFLDITARRQAEEAQRESEGRYRSLVEFVPEPVLVTDRGEILFCNPAAIEFFGASNADQLIGKNHLEMIVPEDRPLVASRMEKDVAARPATQIREIRSIKLDGVAFMSETYSTPFVWNGEAVRLVIIRDISERKKAETERERMLENLLEAHRRIEEQTQALEEMAAKSDYAMREAQAADQAKSEFLALMSHELRTPLNAILGFSDIMGKQTFGPLGDAKYAEYAKDINDSGQHLLDLINDILDLAKVESGEGELFEEKIDINELIAQLTTLVKGRAERGQVALEKKCPANITPLFADKRKMKQILVNLLSNAIKFSPVGGKVELKVWCRAKSGHVFQITDSGIGIAREDISTAMTPFRQVESDITRKSAGTGLGLPLSKTLVELHGGSLELQSKVDGGTKVIVRFPPKRMRP